MCIVRTHAFTLQAREHPYDHSCVVRVCPIGLVRVYYGGSSTGPIGTRAGTRTAPARLYTCHVRKKHRTEHVAERCACTSFRHGSLRVEKSAKTCTVCIKGVVRYPYGILCFWHLPKKKNLCTRVNGRASTVSTHCENCFQS